ncbi:MAG: DUF5074 domain-containing protein [Flavobacteriales bacterium]
MSKLPISKFFYCSFLGCFAFLFLACQPDDVGPQYPDSETKRIGAPGFWLINEGHFNWGDASISFYDTETKQMSNRVFQNQNEKALGDVAQSMYQFDDEWFVVLNNSHTILKCSEEMDELASYSGFNSPRYMLALSDTQILVSSLYGNQIYSLNPIKNELTTFSETADWTEKMLLLDDFIFAEQKSFANTNPEDNKILKINRNGQIISTLMLPNAFGSLSPFDADHVLVLVEVSDEASELWLINTDFEIKEKIAFPIDAKFLTVSNSKVYVAQEQVWVWDSHTGEKEKLMDFPGETLYGFSSSADGLLYFSDAKDYQAQGELKIYNLDEKRWIDTKATGYIPSEIYFQP